MRILRKPIIHTWMAPKELNHILKCSELIEQFVKENKLFKGNSTIVRYFQSNHESSFVSALLSKNESYVFKSNPAPRHSTSEAMILSKWDEMGIKTPKVISTGKFLDIEYLLMEMINTPVLWSALKPKKILSNNCYYNMGQILAKMHSLKSEGYGQISDQNLIGAYKTFTKYINNLIFNNETDMMIQSNIATKSHVSRLKESIEKTQLYFDKKHPSSVVCHMDFHAGNIFKNGGYTVFDPDDVVSCPAIVDIASAYIKTLYVSFKFHKKLSEQLITGYLSIDNSIDKKIFNHSIYIQGFRQMRSWYRKGWLRQVAYMQKYLEAIDLS